METDRETRFMIERRGDFTSYFDVIKIANGHVLNDNGLSITQARELLDTLESGTQEETEPEDPPMEEEKEKFTDEDYLQLQTQLTTMAMLASLLDPEDISKFINAINHAETIGPLVEPTAYRKAMHNLDFLKEIAEATLTFNKVVRTIQAQTYGKVGKDLIDHQEDEDGAEKL